MPNQRINYYFEFNFGCELLINSNFPSLFFNYYSRQTGACSKFIFKHILSSNQKVFRHILYTFHQTERRDEKTRCNSLIRLDRDAAKGKGADCLILNGRFMIYLVMELYVLRIRCARVLVALAGMAHKILNLRFELHGCVGRILSSSLRFVKGLHLCHVITLLRFKIINDLRLLELLQVLKVRRRRSRCCPNHQVPVRFAIVELIN